LRAGATKQNAVELVLDAPKLAATRLFGCSRSDTSDPTVTPKRPGLVCVFYAACQNRRVWRCLLVGANRLPRPNGTRKRGLSGWSATDAVLQSRHGSSTE